MKITILKENQKYILDNQYKLNIFTDGYTLSKVYFIELTDNKYIIEDGGLPFLININKKIIRNKKNVDTIFREVIAFLDKKNKEV